MLNQTTKSLRGTKKFSFVPLRLCGLLFFVFILHQESEAQQQDFQGITAFALEKKISPSFSITNYNEATFNQNLHELGNAFTDFGANYKISRSFIVGGNVRFIAHRNLDNYYQPREMIYGDVTYSRGWKKFSASLRARFQDSFYPLVIGDTKQNSIAYNRDKLLLRYRVNYYLVPFVYGEIYVPINHPTHEDPDRVKAAAGFFYNFNDYVKTEFYYSVSQELNQADKKTAYAIKAAVYYEFR